MIFLNQIGYWGWGSNGLIERIYSLVSPVVIQIIYYNFFKFFPRELGLIVRNITSDGCAAKDGRLQVSNFTTSCFSMTCFSTHLYFSTFRCPFPVSQSIAFFFFFAVSPCFLCFPHCGAWSLAISTALRVLVNMKMRYIYLVGERCKT